jgi:hypothetical protein
LDLAHWLHIGSIDFLCGLQRVLVHDERQAIGLISSDNGSHDFR